MDNSIIVTKKGESVAAFGACGISFYSIWGSIHLKGHSACFSFPFSRLINKRQKIMVSGGDSLGGGGNAWAFDGNPVKLDYYGHCAITDE